MATNVEASAWRHSAVLQQVEGEQHRLWTPASAPQRMEVRCPIITGNQRVRRPSRRTISR
jgi:hypothetical protein